jgi:hypothetical protein
MSVSQQLMKMRSGATNALLPIFEGISNIYLYEFLALDVVGMWVPRIGVSLWRGRIPYDGAKDPVNEGMNPLQLAAKHTWGNFKGLNWARVLHRPWRADGARRHVRHPAPPEPPDRR